MMWFVSERKWCTLDIGCLNVFANQVRHSATYFHFNSYLYPSDNVYSFFSTTYQGHTGFCVWCGCWVAKRWWLISGTLKGMTLNTAYELFYQSNQKDCPFTAIISLCSQVP